jgi:hypothetical protein
MDAELQTQINANWAKVESEIAIDATRRYWLTKLIRGERLPTRELWNLTLAAIQDFHDASRDEFPKTEMAKFVDAAEAWLNRNQGKIWKLAAEEIGR